MSRLPGRGPVLLALLVLGLVFAGCGGGEEGAVEDTMKTYLEALADGDGEKACDQLTGEAKRAVVDEISAQLPELGATSCEDALGALAENLGEDEKSTLRDAEIEVKLDGDTATARPEEGTADAQLRKIDGTWLISRIPF